MKYLKNIALKLSLSLLLVGFAANAMAQNRTAAVQAYNKALELSGAGQFEEAIDMYSQAIAAAEQAEANDEQGQDIIDLVEKKFPQLYFQLARTKYVAFQKQKTLSNLDEAINAFNEAKDIADDYKNEDFASKSSGIVTKLLYTKSIVQFKNNDYDSATATLDKVIARDPDYAQAYYQKGIVIKNDDKSTTDQFLAAMDKAIEVGKKANKSDVVSRANESAASELVYLGSKQTENKNYREAVKLLKRALNYDDKSADAHYRLAEAYNKLTEPDEAIAHANKALQYENGGRTVKAKIYYELATAQKVKANKQEACQAYKNAAYGSFKSPAEHQMEYELKCKSSTN